MAQKPTPASRDSSPRPRSVPRAQEGVKQPRNGSAKSVADARRDLEERGTRNREGGVPNRSDPIADARAARAVAEIARDHIAELGRRGLPAAYSEVAVQLAAEIEDHLQAVPAAALAARGRIPEHAELLADAAATAQAVREAILRVTRGPDGRTAAHAFGLGDPFSARQPQHVLRALERIVAGASEHGRIAADAGLVSDDLHTMRDLLQELRTLPGAGTPLTDEAEALQRAQSALRAYFDLVGAKATIAFAADPESKKAILSALPRADERRHWRRVADDAVPAA
jgi:hypothetical protein